MAKAAPLQYTLKQTLSNCANHLCELETVRRTEQSEYICWHSKYGAKLFQSPLFCFIYGFAQLACVLQCFVPVS
jgi:hypothetical protein